MSDARTNGTSASIASAKDTPSAVAAMFRAKMMELTGARRLRMGAEMHESARRIVLASLPADIPAHERRRRLFLRFYSRDFDPAAREKIADLVARGRQGNRGLGIDR